MRAENDSFLVCGSIDLVLRGLSKLTCLLYAGRKPLGLGCEHRNRLGFVWVVEIDLISRWGMDFDLISV